MASDPVLAAAQLTAPILAEFAPAITALVDLLSTVRNSADPRAVYFTFRNALRQADPSMPASTITNAYRVARYASDQSTYLSKQSGAQMFNRSDAIIIKWRGEDSYPAGIYRYRVEAAITFPGETKATLFSRYIHSDYLLSPIEAYEQAADDLFAGFDSASAPTQFGGELGNVRVKFKVLNFQQYEIGRPQ